VELEENSRAAAWREEAGEKKGPGFPLIPRLLRLKTRKWIIMMMRRHLCASPG